MGEYFAEYNTAGVSARVAYQLVSRIARETGARKADRLKCVHIAIDNLAGVAFPMVRMALHSLGVWIDLGNEPKAWLQGVVYRDLMGYTFRRCFFDAYKDNRRVYPRVTNRGVQSSLFGDNSAIEKGETENAEAPPAHHRSYGRH